MIYFTYQLKTNPDGSQSGPASILPAGSTTGITANGAYYGTANIGSISILTDAGFQANVLNASYQYVIANAANGVITGVERRADHLLIVNDSANTANASNIAYTEYTTWIAAGNEPLPPSMPYDPPDYEGFSTWFNHQFSIAAINAMSLSYPSFTWYVTSKNNAGITWVIIDAFETGKITLQEGLTIRDALRSFNIPIVLP